MRARIQLHSRITTSKKSNECNTQDEAMQRAANTIIGCRDMFLLSPTTNAHTCTAGIKKGTDQRIHVQDTCADQWPETAAQTLRFWRGSERPSAYPPARAGNEKNANSWTRKVRPENGPLLAPLSRRVLRKCGRKTAALFGPGNPKK